MLDSILRFIAEKLKKIEEDKYTTNWIDVLAQMRTSSGWTCPKNGVLACHVAPANSSGGGLYLQDMTDGTFPFKSFIVGTSGQQAGMVRVFKDHVYKVTYISNLTGTTYVKYKSKEDI